MDKLSIFIGTFSNVKVSHNKLLQNRLIKNVRNRLIGCTLINDLFGYHVFRNPADACYHKRGVKGLHFNRDLIEIPN